MLQFGDVLGIFCSLLLLRRALFANLLFVNQSTILLELFADEPKHYHQFHLTFLITLSSRFWSGTLSRIP